MPDEEKIAELVFNKLKAERGERSDEDFAIMLAEKLHEHRSPCHDFTPEDIQCLKKTIKSKIQFAKTKGLVKVGLVLFLLKELFLYAKENLHWGP